MDELHELVTCRVCKHWLKDPRFLPCHHSFCYDCVKHMASDSPGHFDVIACPVCHRGMVLQNTSGGVKALEKDERAEKLVEIYNKLKVKSLLSEKLSNDVEKNNNNKGSQDREEKRPVFTHNAPEFIPRSAAMVAEPVVINVNVDDDDDGLDDNDCAVVNGEASEMNNGGHFETEEEVGIPLALQNGHDHFIGHPPHPSDHMLMMPHVPPSLAMVNGHHRPDVPPPVAMVNGHHRFPSERAEEFIPQDPYHPPFPAFGQVANMAAMTSHALPHHHPMLMPQPPAEPDSAAAMFPPAALPCRQWEAPPQLEPSSWQPSPPLPQQPELPQKHEIGYKLHENGATYYI